MSSNLSIVLLSQPKAVQRLPFLRTCDFALGLAKGRFLTTLKASKSMSEMIRVTLPDGSAREVARGTTPADIAAAIGISRI